VQLGQHAQLVGLPKGIGQDELLAEAAQSFQVIGWADLGATRRLQNDGDPLGGDRGELRLTLKGESHPLTIAPRRLLRFNGRFRLEGIVRRGGNRLQFIPLHRIRTLELTGEPVDPATFPTAEEDRLLAGSWGLDAEEKLSHPAKSLIERVVLRFHGDAIATIEDEPGHPDARLTRERIRGRKALRYEVETILGPYFKRWVRTWGPEVEILEPLGLRAEFRAEAQAMAARYEG